MPRLVSIVATETADLQNTTGITLRVPDSMTMEQVMEAVRNASIDYCRTRDGLKDFRHNCNNFNYADFILCVPGGFLEKYHLETVNSPEEILLVDMNEQLVTEEDLGEQDIELE